MEDNKYYTPELDEISSDFEFEVYNSKDRFFFEGAEGWYKTKMDYGVLGNLANLHRLILDKQIRVKVLDEKDIRDEGFELVDEGEYQVDAYYSKKVDKVQSVIEYRVRLWSDSWVNIWSKDTGSPYFGGTIKNKSEFKKILKMIGV
jgi:hypothetical protein